MIVRLMMPMSKSATLTALIVVPRSCQDRHDWSDDRKPRCEALAAPRSAADLLYRTRGGGTCSAPGRCSNSVLRPCPIIPLLPLTLWGWWRLLPKGGLI